MRSVLISRSAIESGFSCGAVLTSGPTYSSRPSPSWLEEALVCRARFAALMAGAYLDLARPLQLDVEQRGHPGREMLVHRGARGAIKVAGELGVFEQFAAPRHRLEGRPVDEPVLDAVDLAGTGRAGRAGHGHPDVRVELAHRGHHGALAHARRTRQHGQAARHATKLPASRRIGTGTGRSPSAQ